MTAELADSRVESIMREISDAELKSTTARSACVRHETCSEGSVEGG